MFLEFVVKFNMKYFFGKFLKIICKNVLCCKKFMFEGFFYSCFINDLLFYGKKWRVVLIDYEMICFILWF